MLFFLPSFSFFLLSFLSFFSMLSRAAVWLVTGVGPVGWPVLCRPYPHAQHQSGPIHWREAALSWQRAAVGYQGQWSEKPCSCIGNEHEIDTVQTTTIVICHIRQQQSPPPITTYLSVGNDVRRRCGGATVVIVESQRFNSARVGDQAQNAGARV